MEFYEQSAYGMYSKTGVMCLNNLILGTQKTKGEGTLKILQSTQNNQKLPRLQYRNGTKEGEINL